MVNSQTLQRNENIGFHPMRPNLSGMTILAVEDCHITNKALRLLVRAIGARLRFADRLSSATRHLCLYRPSILLIDIGLPDGSGESLIKQFRHEKHRPALIAISGKATSLAQVSDKVVDAKIQKPFPPIAHFKEILISAIYARNRRVSCLQT